MTMTHPGSSIHVSPRRARNGSSRAAFDHAGGPPCCGVLPVPTKSAGQGSDVPWLFLALWVFTAVAALQIPAIVRAPYPIVRAVGTMAILVSLYLIVFARVYLSISLGDPPAFTRPLDTTTALYFTSRCLRPLDSATSSHRPTARGCW